MKRRFLTLTLAVGLLMPVTALADASAAGLGPATSSTGTSSSADSAALQPADTSLLQSTTGSGDGLSSSDSDGNTLQQPATSSDGNLQVMINGDVDGTPHDVGGSSAWWYALWIALGLALVALGLWLWRRQTRRAKFNPFEIVPATPLETVAGSAEVSDAAGDEAPAYDTQLSDEPGADVQTDEEPPPVIGESDEKTGEDGAKHPQPKRKKGRRKRSSRSRH